MRFLRFPIATFAVGARKRHCSGSSTMIDMFSRTPFRGPRTAAPLKRNNILMLAGVGRVSSVMPDYWSADANATNLVLLGAIVLVPPLPGTDQRQHEADPLIVGGVEPEHPLEERRRLIVPTQAPKAEPEAVQAA